MFDNVLIFIAVFLLIGYVIYDAFFKIKEL